MLLHLFWIFMTHAHTEFTSSHILHISIHLHLWNKHIPARSFISSFSSHCGVTILLVVWNHSLVNFVAFKKNEDFLLRYRFTLQQHYFFFIDGFKVEASHFLLDSSHTLCSTIMCSCFIFNAAYCILYGVVIEH